MKAIVLESFGDPSNLRLQEVPDPTVAPGQALVRVRAAGINFADVLFRLNRYPRAAVPHVLGFEIAGEVEAVGEGVTNLKPGDRVFGMTPGGGGYAELAVTHAGSLLPIPDGISFADAASIPVVFATVYHSLVTFGRVTAGERVLVQAAGGGVGTVAVQWAKALGATVLASAGSDEKLERVRALGAEILINYRNQHLWEGVKAAFEDGVDVVLDSIGGKVLEDSLKLLRPFGRLITVGTASGEPAQIDPVRLLAKNLTVSGVYLAPMEFRHIRKALVASLEMIASGRVQPVVGHTFPLAEAAEAHALMESRGTFGKVVLIN